MAIDVEAQLDYIAHIEGILVGALAKEVEVHFFGISFLSFKHVLAFFPEIAGL